MSSNNRMRVALTGVLATAVLGSGLALAPSAEAATSQRSAAHAYAKSKLGKPYGWGDTGPNSFDCSGLVYRAYKNSGKNWKRLTAHGMYNYSKKYKKVVYMRNLRVGDLVFFEKNKDGDSVRDHVGIYADDGKMINAQNRGVVRETVWSKYWKNNYTISYGRVS